MARSLAPFKEDPQGSVSRRPTTVGRDPPSRALTVVPEDTPLSELIGRWGRVRDDLRVARKDGPAWIEAAIVDATEHGVRLESRDRSLAKLDGRFVTVDVSTKDGLFRIRGSFEVKISDPLPVIAVIKGVQGPEVLERRQSIRVRVRLPVDLHMQPAREDYRTQTIDLSGGGARLAGAGGCRRGQRLTMSLWLSSGPVELNAEVLEVMADGSVRVRFRELNESVSKRVMRCIFEAQLHEYTPRASGRADSSPR